MTKKIFRSIFAVACVVLLISSVLVMGVLYAYFSNMQRSQLKMQAQLAAAAVQKQGTDYFDGLNTDGFRLTLVDAYGKVLYDSEADAAAMENHSDRTEIKKAMQTGEGESERYSATLAQKTLYYALRLQNGDILRVSVTQYSVLALLVGILQPVLLVLLAAIVLSALLAGRLAKNIVRPLNAMNLDSPLENDTYEELSPLLTRIEHQQRRIRSQMEELQRRRQEFSAVTDSMNEGLVLLNTGGEILSMNKSAATLFHADETTIGADMLTLQRGLAMQQLLHQAAAGKPCEKTLALQGKIYQMNASPVYSGETVTGTVLLLFDITQRAFAEQQRREFSANVSHELKTPLQSILGSAELLENGLVKPQDVPEFVGRIRKEAGRMVTLINDIIRLSQLDEGGPAQAKETVDLLQICKEVQQSLQHAAGEKQIALTVSGEPAKVSALPGLLTECVYNLCDNGIRYTHNGGMVEMLVQHTAQGASLTVKDNGIGIAPEHQDRVFERFYRVDKSHSRQSGGTGLGLSIVKHCAAIHGATLELQSELGKGTQITLVFPAKASPSENNSVAGE